MFFSQISQEKREYFSYTTSCGWWYSVFTAWYELTFIWHLN